MIIHETRGYLMGYLQTPSDTIQHDHESLEVGYETAMDRSNFFLLNGVIRDEPRASPPPLHAEQPGGMTTDFSKKKILPNEKAHLGCVEEDIRQFTPCQMWLAAPRMATNRSVIRSCIQRICATRGLTQSHRTVPVDSPLDSPASSLQSSVSAAS